MGVSTFLFMGVSTFSPFYGCLHFCECKFVESTLDPTGVGEPPLPPIAPALTAAIHQASGQWVRSLPIGDQYRTLQD